ncbi:MAG: hypothetical protein ACK4NZ_04960 [Tsuneonella sp.]
MTLLLGQLRKFLGFNPVGWERARRLMDRRVAEYLHTLPDKPSGSDIVAVVGPWQGTSIPWFTLVVALMLAGEGARVRFVVDDLPFGSGRMRHVFVMRAIRHVMARVARRFPVTLLSKVTPASVDAASSAEIDRLASLNATWELRGEMLQSRRAEIVARSAAQMRAAQGHIAALFANGPIPDVLWVPGGVFGDSGLWFHEARKRGVRVASFDTGGYQTSMLASDGMACQLDDVPRAFRQLAMDWASDPEDRSQALARAEQEIVARRGGTDAFESQVQGGGEGRPEFDGGILLALNSSWDAAALGPHRAFSSNTDWIVGTTSYLLEHTDRHVIVRQHPAERLAIGATSEDYANLLGRHFGEHPRLHFIAAADPINSYALLDRVAAVVVHTSTIGMEAVAFGRPVVTGSASYYSGLGFVNRADELDAYTALLARAAAGQLSVTEAMREDARLCFYITQCQNWVFSPFNPADFALWSRRPISHWQAQPAVSRMVRSVLTGTPVAVLNHREGGPAAT